MPVANAGDFVGAAQCGKCHPTEFAKQSHSHHARALSSILDSPIAPKLLGHTVQEKNGLQFEYSPAPGGIRVTVENAGQKASASLDWAFGAGVRGITPVGSINGGYFEHRVSWYTAGDRAGLTMGHGAAAPSDIHSALGLKQAPDVIARCFDCHATDSKGSLRPGVECERCHGPGAVHAQAPSARNIRNPGRSSPRELVEFCGQCHRLPPSDVDERETTRFAPIGLMASRCFGGGRISCLTCHDPHADVNRNVSEYVAKCAGCHADAHSSVNCRRAVGDNCLPCHMPQTNVAPYLTFTDHRIRVSHVHSSQTYDSLNDPAKAVAEAQAEIKINPNSLAGYLQLGQIFLEHNTPQPAVDIFSKAIQLAPDSLLAHLGEGLALKGIQRFDAAEEQLRFCLKRDPGMAVAFDALASLYLESLNTEQLGAIAQQYLDKNPADYRGYYYLAAAKEHASSELQGAEALLRKAIALQPDFAASYALLGKLLLQNGQPADAVRELEHAVRLRPDYRPAHLYLGNAYRKLGREADAAREFQLVRKLNDEQTTQPSLRYHQETPRR